MTTPTIVSTVVEPRRIAIVRRDVVTPLGPATARSVSATARRWRGTGSVRLAVGGGNCFRDPGGGGGESVSPLAVVGERGLARAGRSEQHGSVLGGEEEGGAGGLLDRSGRPRRNEPVEDPHELRRGFADRDHAREPGRGRRERREIHAFRATAGDQHDALAPLQ